MCENLLLSKFSNEIVNIFKDEEENKVHVLTINFMDLFELDSNFGNKLLRDPDNLLNELRRNVIKIQDDLKLEGCTKENVSVRIYNLPINDGIDMDKFPRSIDLGTFLQLRGIVMSINEAKILEFCRQFACFLCNASIVIEADYNKHYNIEYPKRCITENCKSKTFKNVDRRNPTYCRNYQEIKIQETIITSANGIPNTLTVTLEDDLVDSCKLGENVIVTGVLKTRCLSYSSNMNVELVLKANNLHVNEKCVEADPKLKNWFPLFWEKFSYNILEGRDIIINSIAPEILGMHTVKLAIALVIAGGCKNFNKDQHNVRAESHLLLLGDPGMGKSELLRFVPKINPNSIVTNGIGTTSAGLTVTAVKEDGDWQLKPGALVMADNGICCIDEFDLMKQQDRVHLHEAMEQQTISVAKANIICKLNTRCSIIAAANSFSNSKIHDNKSSPLLSRFDLILTLNDVTDLSRYEEIADHILNDYSQPNAISEDEGGTWSVGKLREYFATIRQLKPTMTKSASNLLKEYYSKTRQNQSEENRERKTIRMLESLIRLSQAHAKLMFRTTVEDVDAFAVIDLMENTVCTK